MPDIDPGLTPNDLCVFMRATNTDTGPTGTGARTSFPVWWLSPDITLVGPTSGNDKADPGPAVNSVTVNFTLKNNCALPVDANNRVRVELYVGNPSLVMTPASNTKLISTSLVVNPIVGANSKAVSWTIPGPPPPPSSEPDSAGHKCLIARCYPRNLTPDPGAFHQVDDIHLAQRNICIVPCASPCGQEVQTANPTREFEKVTLRVVADLRPNRHVLKTVMEHLSKLKGFKQLSPKPPPRSSLQLKDFPDAKVQDYTQKPRDGMYGRLKSPNFQAQIVMKPKQVTSFRFMTDMGRARFGAHISSILRILVRTEE